MQARLFDGQLVLGDLCLLPQSAHHELRVMPLLRARPQLDALVGCLLRHTNKAIERRCNNWDP